jgi:hypothetical protein
MKPTTTTNGSPLPPKRFVGWLRRGGDRNASGGERPWVPVCSADSESACWRLLEMTPRCGANDLCVLLTGQHPRRALKAPAHERARRSGPRRR